MKTNIIIFGFGFLASILSVSGADTWVTVTPPGLSKVVIVSAYPGRNEVLALTGIKANDVIDAMWSTTNNGATWQPFGVGPGSDPIQIFPLGILYDPAHLDTFWLYGNYVGSYGAALISTDGGVTVHKFGANPPGCGGFCEDEGFSVDFNDPERKTITIGQHEGNRTIRYSNDGGNTWTNIGNTLPASAARANYQLVIDSRTFLAGCSFMISAGPTYNWSFGGIPGLYRTTNKGGNWTRVSDKAVFEEPLVVNDMIYWTFCNTNTIPLSGGLLRSDDKGATWTMATATGLLWSCRPVLLPDGRIGMINNSNCIVASSDHGVTWTTITPPITVPTPWGFTYNAPGKAFFAWQSSGENNNPVNGIVVRLDMDIMPVQAAVSPR
ncbi:MAG TPA: hypothetical protein VGN23_15765 [Verrucomicrobiae bacterium]|jgi:photosystem II stability/assembly factor-like uncharacterized protein